MLPNGKAAAADRGGHGGVAVAGLVGAHLVWPPLLGGALIFPWVLRARQRVSGACIQLDFLRLSDAARLDRLGRLEFYSKDCL